MDKVPMEIKTEPNVKTELPFSNSSFMDYSEAADVKTEPRDSLETMKEEISEIKKSFSQMMELVQTFTAISEKVELRVDRVEHMLTEMENIQNSKKGKSAESDLNSSGIRDDISEDKLSESAKNAIGNLTDDPDTFIQFLMHKTFGKPKPPVLPILKSYYNDVTKAQILLRRLKRRLDIAHMEYKEQRRLDVNLKLRIEKLLRNIDRELEEEAAAGQSQSSLYNFFQKEKPT